MRKIKKLTTLLIICSLFCMILLSGCGVGKNINLNNYLTISYEGYNGYGKATASLDTDALEQDYGNKLKLNTNSNLGILYEGYSVSDVIDDMVGVYVSPSSNLSNGDTITENWDVAKSYIEDMLGCSVSYSADTLTVEGLEEVATTDVFDGVNISLSGNNGYGMATVEVSNQFQPDDYGSFSYAIEPDTGLSNGDTIQISFNITDQDKFISEFGVLPVTTTEEITVSGLSEIGTINVFEGVSLNLTGVSPYGSAELVIDNQFKTDSWFPSYSYELDKTTDLANGDIVTATFSILDEGAFIEEFGALPEKYQAQFSVSGLDSYITDISQLSSDNIQQLKAEAENQLEAYFEKGNFNKYFDFGDLEYTETKRDDFELQNIYMFTPKGINWYDTYNIVFVYRTMVSVSNESITNSGYLYFTVSFNELILESSGNLVNFTDNDVNFFENYDSLYSSWVVSNKDNYYIKIYDSNLNIVE